MSARSLAGGSLAKDREGGGGPRGLSVPALPRGQAALGPREGGGWKRRRRGFLRGAPSLPLALLSLPRPAPCALPLPGPLLSGRTVSNKLLHPQVCPPSHRRRGLRCRGRPGWGARALRRVAPPKAAVELGRPGPVTPVREAWSPRHAHPGRGRALAGCGGREAGPGRGPRGGRSLEALLLP